MAKQNNSGFSSLRIVAIVLSLAVIILGAKLYMVMEDQKKAAQLAKDASIVRLPTNAVKITECIAHEGEHWVEPDKVPNGPYYVSYQGRVLSVEYMLEPEKIPGEKLARGSMNDMMQHMSMGNMSMGDLVDEVRLSLPLPPAQYKALHIGWTAPHVGMLTPHYDIHFDFVTDAELKNVCPDSRVEDIYSPEVLKTINQNNIPFPGQ